MQSRYHIDGIEPRTYVITDLRDNKVYMLYVNAVVSSSANTTLIIAEASYDREYYCTFHKEVLNFSFWARDWQQVIVTIEQIFNRLYNGMNIANPVEHTLEVGGMLPEGNHITLPIDKRILH